MRVRSRRVGGLVLAIAISLFGKYDQVWAQNAAAGAALQVKAVNVYAGNGAKKLALGKLPYFSGGDVATAVNDFIYIRAVETLAPAAYQANWRHEAADPEDKQTYSYELYHQDARVLSLVINHDTCAAYCNSDATVINLDLRNAREIRLSDLLSQRRQDEIALQGQKKILAKLKSLRDQYDDDSAREALADCEKSWRSEKPGLNDFRFTKKSIKITMGSCSVPHALQVLNAEAQIDYELPYASLSADLSAYGKSLLLGNALPADYNASSPWGGRVLKGSLATMPITMLLDHFPYPANSGKVKFSGWYFYDKFKKPIRLEGVVDKERIELHEKSEKGEAAAKFTLSANAEQLQGEWLGKKSFEVKLQGK